MTNTSKPLKRALYSNAIFSTLSATVFLAFPQDVAALVGLKAMPWVITFTGIGLGGFMALIVFAATRLPDSAGLVRLIIAGDWGWVAGSAIAVAFFASAIPGPGLYAICAIALVVTAFALLQMRGLKKLT